MRWLLLAWAAAALASPLQSPLLAPLAFQARIANLTNGDIAQFDLDVLSRSGNHAEVLFRSLADVPAGLDIVRLHELLHPPTPTPTSLDLHASYHTLESLENTMRAWAADFPQYVSLSQIGTSAEGRPLTALTLSKSDQKTPSPHQKLRFLITAGSHAREWIGPSSALFFMDQLLFAATLPPNIIEPQYQRALDNFEFVFVPVSNPDGYLYSWTKDRLWRKTRQANEGTDCVGIDTNRNWGTNFQEPLRPNPCSENYGGKTAFEAVELQGLRNLIVNASAPFSAMLDLHSFGQMIMFPYAYDCTIALPDFENLYEAVIGASKAAHNTHGRAYQAGQICDISYAAGGDSVDYAYSNGVTWSFSAELRDLGTHAFLLPEKEIRPAGEEMLNALLSLTDFVILKEEGKRKPKDP